MTGLLDKVVVVTGAAKGTGRVHCQRFADEGADVIALDAEAAADELRVPQPKSRPAVDGVSPAWPTSVTSRR